MYQLPIYFCSFPFSFLLCRFLPYLIPASEEDGESGPDLSTLRTFRVLRPLKLVSGVPSKHYFGVGPIPTKLVGYYFFFKSLKLIKDLLQKQGLASCGDPAI